MFTQITISPGSQAMIYSLTYMLAFIVAGFVLFVSGYKNKYPTRSWLVIVVTIVFFTILGNKLLTSLPAEWKDLFVNFTLPQTGRKSVLGGIAGLVVGIVVIKLFFRLRTPIADHFAYLVPLTIGIARIGCLLNGCCHGLPTQVLWGIAYGPGTHAYSLHMAKGLIPAGSGLSLAVHPTQVYDILFCLAVLFLIWISRKYWKANGSRLVFAILCYAVFRFVEEFFRDSSFMPLIGDIYWGLKTVQWILLLGILAAAVALFLLERYGRRVPENGKQLTLSPRREAVMLTFIWIVLVFNTRWFSFFELLTLVFFLAPSTVVRLMNAYKLFTVRELQKVLPLLLFAGLLTLGQTYIPKEGDKQITYLEISVDGLTSYYNKYISQYVSEHQDCDGDWHPTFGNEQYHEYTTYIGSFDISKTFIKSKYTKYNIGGGGFFGKDRDYNFSNGEIMDETTAGVHIRGALNWKFFGFGVGFRIGRQRVAIMDKHDRLDRGDFENEMGEYAILPMQFIRVGVQDIFYGELNMTYDLPAGKPIPFVSGGIGTGLGKIDGTNLGAGISDAGFYLKGAYVLKGIHVLHAYCASNFMTGHDQMWVFGLGYRYRFKFRADAQKEALETDLQ